MRIFEQCRSQNNRNRTIIIQICTMQSQYETLDQILQLINSMCSLVGIPTHLSSSSTASLFNDKLYYDILMHLHPGLQDYLVQVRNKENTAEKKLKALVEVLGKHLIETDLKHIKAKKIIEKDAKMTLRFVAVLYQYIKKKLNARRQNLEESELLSSGDEDEELYRKIVSEEENAEKRENIKPKRTKKKTRSESKTNKLSQSDLLVSKQILQGLKKVQSQSSTKSSLQSKLLNEGIMRKKKQLEMKAKELRSSKQRQQFLQMRSQQLNHINSLKRLKSDQQKETYLKRMMREEQKSLEFKLRDQKSLYLRRVNSALLMLQKEKHIEQQKTLRQRINQGNKHLKMELEAIETYYKSQMQLTKECQQEDRRSRAIVDKAYKQIASKLQRELREENSKKLRMVRMKHENELLKWQDQDKIEQEVREIYKKYY